jgi:hypothetical protein
VKFKLFVWEVVARTELLSWLSPEWKIVEDTRILLSPNPHWAVYGHMSEVLPVDLTFWVMMRVMFFGCSEVRKLLCELAKVVERNHGAKEKDVGDCGVERYVVPVFPAVSFATHLTFMSRTNPLRPLQHHLALPENLKGMSAVLRCISKETVKETSSEGRTLTCSSSSNFRAHLL